MGEWRVKVLVANRGEVAARIVRAVGSLGWSAQRVHVAAEAASAAAGSRLLDGPDGVAGYLDVAAVVRAAVQTGCALVHPGWGFLSESPDLARACADAGLIFVGPDPAALELFGDKARAHSHARLHGVATLATTRAGTSLDEARHFFTEHPDGVMVKAVAGGGGRGIRRVTDADHLADAWRACRSEAQRAFGVGDVYVERLMRRAKHIEVQVVGDGSGAVVHLGERECSVQRRHQKLVEWAPSAVLDDAHRAVLGEAAKSLVGAVSYRGLATVEFLVDAAALAAGDLDYAFIEVNPRLQVEHTVTEQVTGLDLVAIQLLLTTGGDLPSVGLTADVVALPGRYAIEVRVNAETLRSGVVTASTGTISALTLPRTARVDTHAAVGMRVDATFDSLLAKVITTTEGTFAAAAAQAHAVLGEFAVGGVDTNAALLSRIVEHPDFTSGWCTTSFFDEHASELAGEVTAEPGTGERAPSPVVSADFAGVVVAVHVTAGERVEPGQRLLTVESMKMEYPVTAPGHGSVSRLSVAVGDQVLPAQELVVVDVDEHQPEAHPRAGTAVDLDQPRADLEEVFARRRMTQDDARADAVGRRHQRGHRTVRENLADLVDPGSFREYGALTVAAQRSRRDLDDLVAHTPADGLVTGIADVNGGVARTSQTAVLAYDATVLAGTQGYFGHKKADRMLLLARSRKLPVVLFAEGGGGRPGDVDAAPLMTSGLTLGTFAIMASLSGHVPTVGVLTGRCFAGNAALLGCCDVIIATEDSNLGMAGPALVEGGGLGRFTADEIGPMSVHGPNGVVDVVVPDDAAAVATAKRYLSYFQEPMLDAVVQDQRRLRHIVPSHRKTVYDVREVVEVIADVDSVLELRSQFGVGAVTALIRVDGRPMGLIANNPAHLGGAIDVDAADKIARFLQLCDAHGLPIVSLCDTPGFLVGPEAEKAGGVRHFSRVLVVAAHLSVPMVTVLLRKGYGLGAQSMAAGGFHETRATVAWPTAEIGPMGLEGAVRLGFAKELDAIEDEAQRSVRYEELLAAQYESGRAINGAMTFELDDVIDPAETRGWILSAVGSSGPGPRGTRYVDTW